MSPGFCQGYSLGKTLERTLVFSELGISFKKLLSSYESHWEVSELCFLEGVLFLFLQYFDFFPPVVIHHLNVLTFLNVLTYNLHNLQFSIKF